MTEQESVQRKVERKGTAPAPSGARIFADDVSYVFANAFVALKSTTLDVEGGSFCTLLGPSGSGKTTLLRVIAGLIAPTTGRVFIGDVDVTSKPVQHRDIGFVFQHYALFPHMTAGQNIDYPLRIRRWSKEARRQRMAEILDLIDMKGFGDRKIDQLSGGQQQRIAIGRALAYNPKVLLLDEPLGALDRKLRQQLGADLRRIQKRAGITALYVTHDQDEAFILSDKVAVMEGGRILQDGPPEQLYASPSSYFVADFLGEANLIAGTISGITGETVAVNTGCGQIRCRSVLGVEIGRRYACSVRPEDISLRSAPPVEGDDLIVNAGAGEVVDRIFLGSRYVVIVEGADAHRFVVETNRRSDIPEVGATVYVTWPMHAAVLVDAP